MPNPATTQKIETDLASTQPTASTSKASSDEWKSLIPPPSPLDQIRLSDDDQERIYETWQIGMSQCIADLGFDMVTVPYSATASSRMEVTTPIDPDVIAQYGYDQPPDPNELPPMGPNEHRAENDPAFRAALIGDSSDPSDGCRGIWSDRTYDENSELAQLSTQLGQVQADLLIELENSTIMLDLDNAWSECMARNGLHFETPVDAEGRYVSNYPPEVTPEEVLTRQADIACQIETGYVQKSYQWVHDRVTQWLDENAQIVDHYLKLKNEHLRHLVDVRASLGLE